MEYLFLSDNNISDLSPLAANMGLGEGDYVGVRNNPLSATSLNTHIPTLQRRGVTVTFDSSSGSGGGGGSSPDLIVESPSVNDNTLTTGQSFTLSVTVRNQGTEQSAATTLRYYLSDDVTIDATDTQVGTDDVSGLSAGDTSAESISLNAPSSTGTYYYGACVDNVSDESNTGNNCSSGVSVTVSVGKDVPSPVVRIPDANLRAAIEADLGKATGAPITAAEMAALQSLSAENKGISDLTGLEYAINLTRLELYRNNISDVSPLSGLTNLTDLRLEANAISDVSPLSGLTNLTILWLNINSIADVSPLSGLTNLTFLWLPYNKIADVSPLSGLTNLTVLSLSFNNVSDVSPLSGLTNLTELVFWGNKITDLSPLSGLTNLTFLSFGGNSIADVSPLSGLTSLTWLWCGSNNITDLSPLSGLTNLTHLLLDRNKIMVLSPLSGLTNLTKLRLSFNKITDLSHLSGLTNLNSLDIRDNRIADLSPLVANSGLAQGAEVDVRGNPLSASSHSTHVPALQRRGVDVLFDPDPENVEEYDAPTLIAQHDDRVVVMGVPGRLRTDRIDFEALAQVFFTHYEDAFDYLMVFSNLPEHGDNQHYTYYGIHLSVQNAVEGTGKSRYSKNQALGSAGRLNAILHFPWNQALLSGPSLHEIMHSWANYTIPTAAGGHWGFSSANGQLGGFDRANLVDHGGGRYSAGDFGLVANGGNSVPYSPIELYFAGLIPPSEVPELWVAEDGTGLKDASGNWVYDDAGYQIFTASKVSTWSIERIVAEHGARIPDSSQSQKEFRAALILAVDPLHPARKSTLDELSAAVQRFTHAGSDDYNFNFWEATGGRATLTMDGLSAYRRTRVAGKRAASYRVVEPEANHDGSIGCIRMDDVSWAGQWMVARPDNGNR